MFKCNCNKCDFCVKYRPTTEPGIFVCCAKPYEADTYCKRSIDKMTEILKSAVNTNEKDIPQGLSGLAARKLYE